MRVGNLDLQPGQTAQGKIEFGDIADGDPLEMPIRVVRGADDGPTLWVNAAIHGDELEGMVGRWQVFDTIAKVRLKGTLIGAIITNVSAFQAIRRTSPIDDLDLNRVFPGEPHGSFTRQCACAYKYVLQSLATHYIDLHGGGNNLDVVYYTIYRDGDGEASRESREMAQAAGSPIVWSSRDPWLANGPFSLYSPTQESLR